MPVSSKLHLLWHVISHMMHANRYCLPSHWISRVKTYTKDCELLLFHVGVRSWFLWSEWDGWLWFQRFQVLVVWYLRMVRNRSDFYFSSCHIHGAQPVQLCQIWVHWEISMFGRWTKLIAPVCVSHVVSGWVRTISSLLDCMHPSSNCCVRTTGFFVHMILRV